MGKKKQLSITGISSVIFILTVSLLMGATVGQAVSTVQVTNAYKKSVPIPHVGEKVVMILYNDYEGADVADPLADAVKDAKIPASVFYSCGIANLEDNPKWLANWLVRAIVKGKVEKYKTDIFLDYTHALKKGWDLGDCDNGSMAVLVGKDSKIKYIKKLRSKEESKAAIPGFMAILNAEIKK